MTEGRRGGGTARCESEDEDDKGFAGGLEPEAGAASAAAGRLRAGGADADELLRKADTAC